MDDLADLIGFLSHSTPEVRKHAVELVQGLTGSPDGIAQLASKCDALVPPLLRLATADPAIARPALTSLVNLAQEPACQDKMIAMSTPARCMDYLKEGSAAGSEDLIIMLLSNLTAAEDGAAALLQLDKPNVEGLNLANLLQRFLAPAAAERDTYEHVATILPNVTRIEAGRRVLMEPGRGTLRALASQLQSSSELRRRGCSGAIKNCCFSCEEDGTADAIVAESEALADMLSVLSGVTPTQHDDVVRENLADSVLCLAKVPSARKKLWEANAPELLKKGYELEEHPGVCEAMEAAAQFFLQDGFQNGGEGEREGEGEGEGEGEDGAEPPGRMVHIEEID